MSFRSSPVVGLTEVLRAVGKCVGPVAFSPPIRSVGFKVGECEGFLEGEHDGKCVGMTVGTAVGEGVSTAMIENGINASGVPSGKS